MINAVREISDKRDDKKLDPPPTWDENMSPDAWARYVRIWNKAEVKPYRKAQALIEDLKKNDKRKGLKEMIVNEIVENQEFDLESLDVIENIINQTRKNLQACKQCLRTFLEDNVDIFGSKQRIILPQPNSTQSWVSLIFDQIQSATLGLPN